MPDDPQTVPAAALLTALAVLSDYRANLDRLNQEKAILLNRCATLQAQIDAAMASDPPPNPSELVRSAVADELERVRAPRHYLETPFVNPQKKPETP